MEIEVNLQDKYNKSFVPFFRCKNREAVLYGGAGAGKSYAVAFKIILFCLRYQYKKILIIRKTYPALELTCLDIIIRLLEDLKIPYDLNKTKLIMKINTNTLIFKSLDDPQKIKSITDVDMIWVEEPTEISEDDYIMITLRLRGGELKEDEYRQIMLSFNPIDEMSWLKKRFFDTKIDNTFIGKYTYKDNRFLDKDYIKILEDLKNRDEYLYRVYALGEWGVMKGKVYNNYVIENFDNIVFDDIIAGIDFGYTSPTAYVLIGLKDDDVYIIDEIYRTHLTTPEIIELVKQKNQEWNVNPTIFSDTEPDRIEEFRLAGLDIREASKDVIARINYVRTLKIHIHPRCVNFIKEISSYKFKEDKNGNLLEVPVKFNDHCLDAMGYALYTNLKSTLVILSSVISEPVFKELSKKGTLELYNYIQKRRKYA